MPKPKLVVGPVTAWRSWRLEGNRLVSEASGDPWPLEGPFTARCLRGRAHPAPARGCKCGVYATVTRRGDRWPGLVVGEVALWGRVVRHTHGYRAQYARPTALLVLYRGEERAVRQVAAAYGVPALALSAAERRADESAYQALSADGAEEQVLCTVCVEGAWEVLQGFSGPLRWGDADYLAHVSGQWPPRCGGCGRRWRIRLAAAPNGEAQVEFLPNGRLALVSRRGRGAVRVEGDTVLELREALPPAHRVQIVDRVLGWAADTLRILER